MKNTREKILLTALQLFAREGYEAVSTSTIAGELGMTKAALYRHYKNKRDIFDSIVKRMELLDRERAGNFQLPTGTRQEMEEEYRQSSLEQILKYSRAQLEYWVQDPFASLFRKMLTLEQYRNPEMERLYQQYLVLGPLQYLEDLFVELAIPDGRQAAMELYAPKFFLCSIRDGAEEEFRQYAELHFQRMEQKFREIKK